MSTIRSIGAAAVAALSEIPTAFVALAQASARGLAAIWEILAPNLTERARQARALWESLDAHQRRMSALAVLAALVLLTAFSSRHAVWHWYDANIAGNRPLLAAKSWYYHLDKVEVDRIAQTDADLLVIDYAKEDGGHPLTKEEVARLKVRKDGRKRIVISYISIGEAESYRFYWRNDWTEDDMPGWHVAENCAWPRNHMVRYWHDGWKDIIYRSKRSYLARIIEAGFDGVYLDRVDVYGPQEDTRPTARNEMIEFVTEMAATARKTKPGFIFIAQNAEDLLSERRYRDVIDGLGKEDLLNGMHGTGKRNTNREIAESLRGIKRLLADWKPVFAVEYLPTKELIATARKELLGLGIVPTFAHRSLDGFDPTLPRADEQKQYGTPEWIATQCKNKPHW